MPDGPNPDMIIRKRFPSVSQIGEAKGGGEIFTIISKAFNGSYQTAAGIVSTFTGWNFKTVAQQLRLAWEGKKELYKAFGDIALEEVGKKLGMSAEQLEKVLEKKGVLKLKDHKELMEEAGMPYKLPVPTFSGRIEIYSTLFAHFNYAYGYDEHWNPVLAYIPIEYRKGANEDFMPKDNEFFFAFGKTPQQTYLTTADNPLLMSITERYPNENFGFWINPSRAEKLGLKEGDKVEVENTVSGQKVKSFVHLTELVRPDTLYVMSDFGIDNKMLTYAAGKGVDLGRLIPNRLGPVTAGAMSCQFTVKLRKI